MLFRISHDNHHHLNSLWLQTVGIPAPTWLMRLLSVVTGTLAVPVAAAIARPRGAMSALVTALLFAVSPILVTMGSEARGYAPMALLLLVAILFVDRALTGDVRYHRPQTLALCFALGVLARLTMVFGVVALVGWADPAWFPFGYYEPFRWLLFLHAIVEMVGFTIGFPIVTILLPIAALALLVLAPRLGGRRVDCHRLAPSPFRRCPAAAIRTLRQLLPGEATVMLDRPTGRAILVVAAAQAHYPLRIVTAACPTASLRLRRPLQGRDPTRHLRALRPRPSSRRRAEGARPVGHPLDAVRASAVERAPCSSISSTSSAPPASRRA